EEMTVIPPYGKNMEFIEGLIDSPLDSNYKWIADYAVAPRRAIGTYPSLNPEGKPRMGLLADETVTMAHFARDVTGQHSKCDKHQLSTIEGDYGWKIPNTKRVILEGASELYQLSGKSLMEVTEIQTLENRRFLS